MAVKDRRIGKVVDLWYGAGFGERPWAEALHATADLVGGGAAAVLDLNRSSGRIGCIHVYDLDQTVNEYVTRMNRINPRVHHSLARPGPHVVTDYRVLPESALGRNEFYDWIERHHGVRYFVGARIYDDGPRSLLASVEFTRRHGHADDEIVETFERVIPHIANAWRISELTQALNDTRGIAELLVSQRLCGVVGLRADGSVLFMNTAAENAVGRDDGLSLIDGRLHAARAATDRTIQGMIARVLQIGPDKMLDRGGVIAVPRPSGRTPFALRVLPCGPHERHRTDPLPAALIMIANPDQRTVLSAATCHALGLTAAETRIAQRLCAGNTLAEAARDLGILHNTARAHLRSIFEKTQARSQVEMVRILCEFARLDEVEPP
jgi:DNA-binding CsgD family transcriptional regulator